MSQLARVTMWAADLPCVRTPSWQAWHLVPGGMPVAWLKRAPLKDCVLWQLSQACLLRLTGMWLTGKTTLARENREPAVWQVWQSLGVPLNTPLLWQDSQRRVLCAPLSGKPVLKWSNRAGVVWARA